ncbi:MAG: ATPase V [Paludibacteraceae bacterium]|nr:ATPase V [Paludibacteraceae bacterium]
MKKYTFLVLASQYDAFLERVREAGVVHVTLKAEGLAEDEQLRKTIADADALTRLIEAGAPEQLLSDRNNVAAKIEATKKEAQRMAIWGSYSSQRIAELKAAGYELHFFTCSKKVFDEKWGSVVAQEGDTLYCVAVTKRQNDALVTLNGEPFVLPDACTEHTLNEHSATELQADIDALNGLLAAADARIEAWGKANLDTKRAELQELRRSIEWQKVQLSSDSAADGTLRLMEGFCPTEKVEELNKVLAELDTYYEVEDPVEGDATPVKLNNNKFAKLFEVFTGMYGWPTYGEFDPTPILAPFYLLFFSMCMGDAGYGILLMLFGWLTYKGKLKIEMFEGLGPIIMTLGVGTLVVGFFLGTAFGMDLTARFPGLEHIILNGKVVTEGGVQYLSKAAYAASGLEGGYDVAMVLALLIGVFHICLAMVVKALCYTKRFGFRAQLGTWGWTLLIVGGIAALIICMALSVPMEVTKIVLIVIAGISALGIYIFNTPGRNPLLNIGAGLWDTYNMATGILGDTLSYIRLYALGLAGGMLGGAFNNLGLMVMGGSTEGATWQWLPFIVILIIGHLLNLAMSALGAFVHPLRLTFVEYFKNSGYEGKGNLYRPFSNAEPAE